MSVWKWIRSRRRRNVVIVTSSLIWLALFTLAHTNFFYWFEWPWLNRTFAEAFWPNFIADAGVGILLAWLLGEALDQASHYDLEIELETSELNPHETRIWFYLINSGQESFKRNEIKYHVFVEDGLGGGRPPHLKPKDVELDSKRYKYYKGEIEEALYPGERIAITYLGNFELRRGAEDTTIIYYYFGTEHGHIPHTVKNGSKLDEMRLQMIDGNKTIQVELPKLNYPKRH